MRIVQSTEKDFRGMISVAKELHPKWFDKFAINKSLPFDLRIHRGFVAKEKDKILGFITYTSKEGKVEISWVGVCLKFQGKNIGTKLVKALEIKLKGIGVKDLTVETLAESTKYEPYEKTRLFYKKLGFKVASVKKIKSKDTGEESDLATLIKSL